MRGLAAGGAVLLGLLAVAAPASASPRVSTPSVVITPHFVKGSEVSDDPYDGPPDAGSYTGEWRWAVTSSQPITAQSVTFYDYDYMDGYTENLDPSARSAVWGFGYDQFRGGVTMVLTVTNATGTTTMTDQENEATTHDDADPGFTYSGTWKNLASDSAYATGPVNQEYRQTTTKNASVSFQVGPGATAIAMPTGPNEGGFDYYVDGTLRDILTGYSRTASKNDVVLRETYFAAGRHTIKLVNPDLLTW